MRSARSARPAGRRRDGWRVPPERARPAPARSAPCAAARPPRAAARSAPRAGAGRSGVSPSAPPGCVRGSRHFDELVHALRQLSELASAVLCELGKLAFAVSAQLCELASRSPALQRALVAPQLGEFAITAFDERCELALALGQLGNLSLAALGELCELAFSLGQLCDLAFSALGQFGELALTAFEPRCVRQFALACLGQRGKFALALGEGLLGGCELRPLLLELGEERRVAGLGLRARARARLPPARPRAADSRPSRGRGRAARLRFRSLSCRRWISERSPVPKPFSVVSSIPYCAASALARSGPETMPSLTIVSPRRSPVTCCSASARSRSSPLSRPCSTSSRPRGRQVMWAASTDSLSASLPGAMRAPREMPLTG